jgi:hypothetical protein
MDPQGLSSSLDFSPGLDLARKVRSSFSTLISPSSDSEGFHFVVSFGRAIFKLDLDLLGILFNLALGAMVMIYAFHILEIVLSNFLLSLRLLDL